MPRSPQRPISLWFHLNLGSHLPDRWDTFWGTLLDLTLPFLWRTCAPFRLGFPCAPSQQPPWLLWSTEIMRSSPLVAWTSCTLHRDTPFPFSLPPLSHISKLPLHLRFHLLELHNGLHSILDHVKITGLLSEQFLHLIDLKCVIFNLWKPIR